MVKRQGTTKAKVILDPMEDIAEKLVINWDQAGLKYVPVSDCTFEEMGWP